MALDRGGIAGAVIDSAVIDQDPALIEQIAFRRAACAKGGGEGAVIVQRIILLIALCFCIGLHFGERIAAIPGTRI
jgi:hypothetical protein